MSLSIELGNRSEVIRIVQKLIFGSIICCIENVRLWKKLPNVSYLLNQCVIIVSFRIACEASLAVNIRMMNLSVEFHIYKEIVSGVCKVNSKPTAFKRRVIGSLKKNKKTSVVDTILNLEPISLQVDCLLILNIKRCPVLSYYLRCLKNYVVSVTNHLSSLF